MRRRARPSAEFAEPASRFDTIGPTGGASGVPMGYEVLLEEAVPASLDVTGLADELASETWTADTLILKALTDDGARDFAVRPWVGRSRDFTFRSKLNIPWERFQILSRNSVERNAFQKTGASQDDLMGRCQVYQASDKQLIVQVSFLIPTPLPKLHVVFTLQPDKPKGFVCAGAVEFEEAGGVLDIGIVKRFVKKGYMQGAKSFGRRILSELQQQVEDAPTRRPTLDSLRSSTPTEALRLEGTSTGVAEAELERAELGDKRPDGSLTRLYKKVAWVPRRMWSALDYMADWLRL